MSDITAKNIISTLKKILLPLIGAEVSGLMTTLGTGVRVTALLTAKASDSISDTASAILPPQVKI